MIPLIAALRVGRGRAWIPIPLFVAWLLLLPLCLLAVPFFLIACAFLDVPGLRALVTFGGVLRALRGSIVEISAGSVDMALRLI